MGGFFHTILKNSWIFKGFGTPHRSTMKPMSPTLPPAGIAEL